MPYLISDTDFLNSIRNVWGVVSQIKNIDMLVKKYLLILTLVCFAWTSIGQTSRPNIIFILADDLGYGDLSCFNNDSKIRTPNIDRIANAGVRFTDAHSASSVCTPTRYAILTGRYAWRTRLNQGVLGTYDLPLIEKGRTTMASMLKQKGYTTAAIGKWHLGWNWTTTDGKPPYDHQDSTNIDFSKPLGGGALDVGFNHFFGMDAPNFPPYTYIEDRNVVGSPTIFYSRHPYRDCRQGRGVEGWDLEQILPELRSRSTEFISAASGKDQPFFLYLPITAPHTPIAPAPAFKGGSGLNVYADFVKQVDDFVGGILEALEKNKIADNTILIFTADNGCSPEANFPFLQSKGHYPSAQFRGHKADLFEGGHRVPLVVQWPARIKTSFSVQQTVCLNDFFASFASLTGYQLSNDEGEDSYNIMPLLLDPTYNKIIREATVHHSLFGDFAIRKGKWKLLTIPGSGGWSFPSTKKDLEGLPPVQLYNMENDPAEKNNLFDKHPDVVKELQALLVKYQSESRSTASRK